MLPEATEARRLSRSSSAVQTSLDAHAKPTERAISYTDSLFKQVALEWLIATDQVSLSFAVNPLSCKDVTNYYGQPIIAFEHPKFKEMVDIASRAKTSVKIPGRKATRQEIIDMFHNHLRSLKERLNVCISYFLPSPAQQY